jgi:hypothetical protein
VTYAGHGAQVEDIDGDEEERRDETWCVYDRMILDDELYDLWGVVPSGAVVLVVSDSCHSGTVARMVTHLRDLPAAPRQLSPQVARSTVDRHRALYRALRAASPGLERPELAAALILLSGCQDHQLSSDGARTGLFTEKLLQTWNEGHFAGSYTDFVSAVRQSMPFPTIQTPGLDSNAAAAPRLAERPFSVSAVLPATAAVPAAASPSCACPCTTNLATTHHEETDMASALIDNGNWEDVLEELSRTRSIGGGNFMQEVIEANARAAQMALGGGATGLAPTRGGSVFRVFWWGCHLQASPEDLRFLYTATDPNGVIVTFLRQVIPASYQWLITLIAGFVVVSTQVLRAADRGRGVYISMSWFAPGILVPTTV